MDPPLLRKCTLLVKSNATQPSSALTREGSRARHPDRQVPSAAQLPAFPAGVASAGAEPPLGTMVWQATL